MAYSKASLLDKAIKIVTSYTRGGGSAPDNMLRLVYKQLQEINSEID